MMRTLQIATMILVAVILSCHHGGHRHDLRDRDAHAPSDIETYIARLESPARVEALQVDRVIATLSPRKSDTLADIGSGPGVFTLPLARVVTEGLVYAVDIEPKQLDALRSRAASASVANIIPVLAAADDPFLPPGRIDLALIVDTYHHIENRVEYFRRLRRALTKDGRLAVVEWKAGKISMGPPPAHKLAPGVRANELEQAGWERIREFDFHSLHDFEVWRPNVTVDR